MNYVTGKILRPSRTVLYGPEGVGKTVTVSHCPEALYADLEEGSWELDVRRIATPQNWEGLREINKEVATTPGICQTYIIDTADKAEMLCADYICRKHHVDGIESIGYGKGYVYLMEEYARFLGDLDGIIAAGINVVILAHAKMRKFEQPDEMGAYDRWELKLTKQVAPIVKEWADAVLFLNYKTYVIQGENGTKKGTGGKRMIFATHSPVWDAKNRVGFPDEMDLTYENIAPLFEHGIAQQEKADKPEEPPLTRLKAMMKEEGVSEEEVRQVVSDKGHYSMDKPISEYDEKFIRCWIIAHWEKIVPIIMKHRSEGN